MTGAVNYTNKSTDPIRNMASSSSSISSFPSSSSSAASLLQGSHYPAARVAFLRRRRCQFRVSASCASKVDRPARAHIGSSGSLYEVLGIQAGATSQEIKAAYRGLARVLHPDVAPASGDCADREFVRLHEAYATLSDPQKRADYDRALLITRRRRVCPPFAVSMSTSSRGSSTNSGFRAYTRRRWETDQCW